MTDINSIVNNLCMKGTIGTKQKCPECGKKFSEIDRYGLYCSNHPYSRPTRYYVQGKFFGVGVLHSTPQGEVLDSYERAKRLLGSIQTKWDDSQKGDSSKKFNPEDFIPKKVKAQRFSSRVDELLKEYDKRYERNKLSKSRYQAVYNICDNFLKPYFNNRDIRDITGDDGNKFFYHLLDLMQENGERYSDYHIRDVMSMLKTLFMKYRPADIPKFPEGWQDLEPKKEKQRLQFDRQMEIAPFIPERHGYRLAISILQTTGMRTCELRALQVNDIVDGGLMIWKSLTDRLKLKRKNGGEQYYPLPDYLLDDLKKHIDGKRSDDFIFTINGKPFGDGRLRKVWNKAVSDAGVKHIELYQACRHSWASREMRKAKEDAIERISRQLGNLKDTAKKHDVVER